MESGGIYESLSLSSIKNILNKNKHQLTAAGILAAGRGKWLVAAGTAAERSWVMGIITGAFISPHPPILIPEVGKGEEKKAGATLAALKKAAGQIAGLKPSTIVLTTPHGPVFRDYIFINPKNMIGGDLGKFGASRVRLQFENNIRLTTEIILEANQAGIPCGGLDEQLAARRGISEELDHGAIVPLYFITEKYSDFKLVHIAIAGLPFEDLYRFGKCIARAVERSDENVVFVASGDLSHRLSPDGPYGYDERGPLFDRQLVNCLAAPDPEGLLKFDEGFAAEAGECGLRSFIMMFGALDGRRISSEVYSYEGPFGVGYAVAGFAPGGKTGGESLLDRLERMEAEKMSGIRSSEDTYVALARKALEVYVLNSRVLEVSDVLPPEMANKRAGVFVSIKKSGQLRGCIGTIFPVRRNIADEIIHNAISAGTEDPRFNPVRADELDSLVYSVDVLGEPEPISSINELDVKRYGVIVRAGRRSGLLLPDLEGVDTPQEQVSIALRKAGISPGEKFTMERFEVVRHK